MLKEAAPPRDEQALNVAHFPVSNIILIGFGTRLYAIWPRRLSTRAQSHSYLSCWHLISATTRQGHTGGPCRCPRCLRWDRLLRILAGTHGSVAAGNTLYVSFKAFL